MLYTNVFNESSGAPIPQRWIFAFMGFLALVMAYGMRVSLSITITEMVKHVDKNVTIDEETCPKDENSGPKNTTGTGAGTYDWDEETQVKSINSYSLNSLRHIIQAKITSCASCNFKFQCLRINTYQIQLCFKND